VHQAARWVNHTFGDVQRAATGNVAQEGEAAIVKNHEGSGVRLIGWFVASPLFRFFVFIAYGDVDCRCETAEPSK
jgi:hypothetical protein